MKTIIKTPFKCYKNGLTIRGFEYRPGGDDLPIAVISHGFMANHKTVVQYAKLFAELGFAAYCFDFCGGCVIGGKSDGKTTDMSVLTETEDLKAVIAYAKGLPYTDENTLVLMGCSQGGFVSALTAAELKEQVTKLVLFYPAFCIPDDARAGKMMWAKFDPANIPEIVRCGPMKLGRCYMADVINMNPFEEIKEYDGDVLIVHGTKDKIVNASYAERAVAVYNARENGTAKLYFIDGGGHMFSQKHDVSAISILRDHIQNNE